MVIFNRRGKICTNKRKRAKDHPLVQEGRYRWHKCTPIDWSAAQYYSDELQLNYTPLKLKCNMHHSSVKHCIVIFSVTVSCSAIVAIYQSIYALCTMHYAAYLMVSYIVQYVVNYFEQCNAIYKSIGSTFDSAIYCETYCEILCAVQIQYIRLNICSRLCLY